MKKLRWLILSTLLIMLAAGNLSAADEPVKVTGEKVRGETEKKLTFVEGNVRIVQGETVIETAKVKLDMTKKLAFMEETVKLSHPEVKIKAVNLDYDLKKKAGTFLQNVVMSRAEMKDERGKIVKDAFKLTATELYFETDTKNFTAKTGCRVEHKDFTGTAEIIEYNDKRQELFLKENAVLSRPEGEEITGKTVKIFIKDKNFIVTDQVNISFEVEEEKSASKPKKGRK